jgi:hypothetical protein
VLTADSPVGNVVVVGVAAPAERHHPVRLRQTIEASDLTPDDLPGNAEKARSQTGPS